MAEQKVVEEWRAGRGTPETMVAEVWAEAAWVAVEAWVAVAVPREAVKDKRGRGMSPRARRPQASW